MATQETKGWIWTPEEKQWIKSWKRDVLTAYKRIAEQVDRFQTAVPAFADEAASTADPIITEAQVLLDLAKGAARRKYQTLSPDEARKRLNDGKEQLKAWKAFTNRPDVQAAICDANRQIGAQKSAQRKKRREARVQMEQQFKSTEYAQVLDYYVDEVFKETAKFVALGQGYPFIGFEGTDDDRPELQRLMVVHFIRACTMFCDPVHTAVEQFVQRQPPPTLKEVLRHTIDKVIQDHCNYPLSARSGSGPQKSIQEVIIDYIQDAYDWLLQTNEQWKNEGRTISSVREEYFTLFDVDYSPAAQPEAHGQTLARQKQRHPTIAATDPDPDAVLKRLI